MNLAQYWANIETFNRRFEEALEDGNRAEVFAANYQRKDIAYDAVIAASKLGDDDAAGTFLMALRQFNSLDSTIKEMKFRSIN